MTRGPRRGRASEAAAIIERDERERERQWLDRLQSELGRNARGVAGPGGHARGAQRAAGRGAAGARTASAPRATRRRRPDFLSTEPGSSPTGEELQKRDDVIESAIESALEQSAEVVVVRHHPDLEALGSIGAVLRY